jgi:hypothetical protein
MGEDIQGTAESRNRDIAILKEKALKVHNLLADNNILMSEAVAFSAQIFMMLAVMDPQGPKIINLLTRAAIESIKDIPDTLLKKRNE